MNSNDPIFDSVVIHGTRDLAAVVCWLDLRGLDWCIIGGHGVNSYAPPALYDARLSVAVDVDAENLVFLLADLAEDGFAVRLDARSQVAHAIREGDGHRLRVSLHHGPQFQAMQTRATRRAILGREMPVASLPDTVAALLWEREKPRQSERLRVESEMHLLRLAEQHADAVDALLPFDLRSRAERDREHALACVDGDGWGEPFAL